MIRLPNIVINVHAIGLLLLSLYFLFLFLVSGHRLNFKDIAQVKLLLEVVIYFLTAVALFFRRRNFLFGDVVLIVLLVLVQVSFIDIYIEISDVDYIDGSLVILYLILFVLFVSNLFLIYSQIKTRIKPR